MFGRTLAEGKMAHKVFSVDEKVVTKKRIMQLLNKEYAGLDPKTLEFDDVEPLHRIFTGRGFGYHTIFRCWGTQEDTGEKFKAYGYVVAGVENTDKGIKAFARIVIDV